MSAFEHERSPPSSRRVLPAVFMLALVVRVAFLLGTRPAFSYSTSFAYTTGALEILEHPAPLDFVLRSDDWHLWRSAWTVAPLYVLFVAGVFGSIGTSLVGLQLVQAVLDSGAAVAVGALGRALDARRGAWAGVAYALWWPAVEFCADALTENLHTALLVTGLALLAHVSARLARSDNAAVDARLVLAGALLGLSALTRAVSLAFLPLASFLLAFVAWRSARATTPRRAPRLRRALAPAALLLAGGFGAVAPWTLRNAIFTGDLVAIETVSFYNLWNDNAFVKPARYGLQEGAILAEPTPAAQRRAAASFALENVLRAPREVAAKAAGSLRHFFRPEGLQLAFVVEEPRPLWRHVARVLGDDVLVLGAVLLLVAALVAARRTPALLLALLWLGYYLFMIVAVFHSEIRYRSAFVPVLFAAATAGLAAPSPGPRRRVGVALLAAFLALGLLVAPYARRAAETLAAWRAWQPGAGAAARGDQSAARAAADAAAALAPDSARPPRWLGHALAHAGRAPEAAEAYARAEALRPMTWPLPAVVLPQLLRQAGRDAEAAARFGAVGRRFPRPTGWRALDAAWDELPPPRTDEVLVGRDDYGALRGFGDAYARRRWTLARAEIRLRPTREAPWYEATLDAGSPEPSPFAAPELRVSAEGLAPVRCRLTREIAPCRFRLPRGPNGVLVVRLEAPVWTRAHAPVEAGVQVARFAVRPLDTPVP
jgi:hypothetical protein